MTTYQGTRVSWRPTPGGGDANKGRTDMGRGDLVPDFTGGGAACTSRAAQVLLVADPDLFHPSGSDPKARQQARTVIETFCDPCPMRVACGDWGRRYGRQTGIWGGVWLDEERRVG